MRPEGSQRVILSILVLCQVSVLNVRECPAEEASLASQLKNLKVPPAWMAGLKVEYDLKTPWKQARQDIRKLLSEGKNREAMKLTYIYHKESRGSEDGHEYPMYLFMGGEHVWATKVYLGRLRSKPEGHTWEYRALASLYTKFGEHQKALAVLGAGLERLPEPPWKVFNMANVHDSLGDVYADMGDAKKATEHYRQAIEAFGKARPKYGRHLLPRRISKTQAKIDLLTPNQLDITKILDGVYRGSSLGYGKPLNATVTVKGGKVVDIKLQHQEKIEQGATKSVPKQIIERQSLEVDAITGATVTVQAITEATYRALKAAKTR